MIGKKLLNIRIIKKFYFSVCMYKMLIINKETYEKNNIEAIVDGFGMLWINEKHIEGKLGHKNLPFITGKYDQMYKNHRYELIKNPKKQPNERFLSSDLALKIIMNWRTNESSSLKKKKKKV